MSPRTTFVQLVCFVNSIIESEVTWRNIDQQIMVPNYSIRNSFYLLSAFFRWQMKQKPWKYSSVRGQFSILVTYFCRWFEKMENYSHWTPNVQKWYLYIRKLNLKTLQIKENKTRKRLKRWKCNKTWASTNCRKSVKF